MIANHKDHFKAKLNFLLYVLLLIITPFLFLRNYLQDAILQFSRWSVNIGTMSFPILFSIAIIGILGLILFYRKQLTLKNTALWAFVLFMWLLGQSVSDVYLDARIYDLQNNWHYIAYGIFAFLVQRLLTTRNRFHTRKILITFFLVIGISTFDETVQFFISNRVFDISDIAKDLWGAMMGLIIFNMIISTEENKLKIVKVRKENIKAYLNAPFSLLVILLIFSFIFLFISSLHSDFEYLWHAVVISIGLFLIVLFIIHKTGSKRNRIITISISTLLIIASIISFTINYDKSISYTSKGLIIYHGIPIPYFDFIIHENGTFKLMDKKSSFMKTDIKYLYKKASNILIIGSPNADPRKMGFPNALESQFVFNPIYNRAIQVIVLPVSEAALSYNRIRLENKEVVLVINND